MDKRQKPPDFDVFGAAWKRLLGMFDGLLERRILPGFPSVEERGMLIPDATDKRLTGIMRRIVSGDAPQQRIIEDPTFRESHESLFIQAADTAAFLLTQHLRPNSYIKEKSGQNYFRRLDAVIWTEEPLTDAKGIVWV